MYSPSKTPSKFQTPMRRVLEDKENNSPPPSPRTFQQKIEHVLQESAQKDRHISWMEAQNGQLSHEIKVLKTNRSRSSSPQKLLKLLDENAQSNTYISYMEEETSQNLNKIHGLEIKLEESRAEISKLVKTNKDCIRRIETRENKIEEILQQLERCREKKQASDDRVLSLLEQQARDEQERANLVRVNNGLHTDVKHASVILKEKDRTHAEDKEELRKLQVELEHKSRQEKVQAEDNADLKKENASLRKHLTEELAKSKDMDDLEKKLKETTEEMDDLKQKLWDNTHAMEDQMNINRELKAKLEEAKNINREFDAKLAEAKNSNREIDVQPAEAKTKLAEEQEGQLIQPTWYPECDGMKDVPTSVDNEASGNYHPALLPASLASPPAVGTVQPWEWLKSLRPSILYEKKDEAEKRTLEELQEETLQADKEYEDMMVHFTSEAEEEEEANMEERREDEDTNDLTHQLSSNEGDEERNQDLGVDTDEEENQDKMPQPSDETEEPKEDKFRGFLFQHFSP